MNQSGPRLRLVRRLGPLPALTKKSSKKRNKTPGQHGKKLIKFQKDLSAYGLRLVEKQKLRLNYNINERQFVGYIEKAKRATEPTGEVLLRLLEMRLDNIVYRLGMASTILSARQLVTHGHILVNGQKVNIPSYGCQLQDVISVKNKKTSRQLIETAIDNSDQLPKHLSLNKQTLVGVINGLSSRDNLQLSINELLVIEYYSRN